MISNDEDIEELDRRWDDYNKGKAKLYTVDEVGKEICEKLKTIKH